MNAVLLDPDIDLEDSIEMTSPPDSEGGTDETNRFKATRWTLVNQTRDPEERQRLIDGQRPIIDPTPYAPVSR